MTSPLSASLATSKSTSLYVCFPNLVVIGLKEAEMSTLINYDMNLWKKPNSLPRSAYKPDFQNEDIGLSIRSPRKVLEKNN